MSWYIRIKLNKINKENEIKYEDVLINETLAIKLTPFLEDSGFIKREFFKESFYKYLSEKVCSEIKNNEYNILNGYIFKNIKEHFKEDMLDMVNSKYSKNIDKFKSWDTYLQYQVLQTPVLVKSKCKNFSKKETINKVNVRSSHATNYFYNPN